MTAEQGILLGVSIVVFVLPGRGLFKPEWF